MIWGRVTTRARRVLIVATGPSVEGIDLTLPNSVHIIAVNSAIEWIPRADSFFTLDPSMYVRSLVRYPRVGVLYHMAVPDDYGEPNARVISHRTAPDAHPIYLRRLTGNGYLGARDCLSDNAAAIHTGNSAYGALGVAWHMGAERIGILGLDGTTDRYAYVAGNPVTSFDHLPGLFASTRRQIEARGVTVLNGSPNSKITCFARFSPSIVIDWLVS